ncbi:MAG: large conductance mechanosensitive channel protein MscL [Ruminococcaceae bacterium]|nr:large conductance mechanosensitive channel protein MscL [Oscillospiraceae bacterium]
MKRTPITSRRNNMGKADMDAIQSRIEAGEKAEKESMLKKRKKELKKKTDGFFKDLKKFITKGNVIDLAVAVVIGTAFNAIVNGLVKFIINPCIALLTGDISMDGIKTVLKEEVLDEAGEVVTAEISILWGEWIQTILNFLIIALSIFVAVRIITRAQKRLNARELAAKAAEEAKKKEEEKAKAEAAALVQREKEEALARFYENVEKQTALLEKIAEKQA